jgi:aryl-alcohol dehydrogenase-like predicted oxidoreductase
MASGLLTGSFAAGGLDHLAPDDWRRRATAFQEPAFSRALALVERLRPVAARLGVTLPALAVAWALALPGVTGAIVGARRPCQVSDWLAAGDLRLAGEDIAEIERAVAETGAGTTEPTPPPPVRR